MVIKSLVTLSHSLRHKFNYKRTDAKPKPESRKSTQSKQERCHEQEEARSDLSFVGVMKKTTSEISLDVGINEFVLDFAMNNNTLSKTNVTFSFWLKGKL